MLLPIQGWIRARPWCRPAGGRLERRRKLDPSPRLLPLRTAEAVHAWSPVQGGGNAEDDLAVEVDLDDVGSVSVCLALG